MDHRSSLLCSGGLIRSCRASCCGWGRWRRRAAATPKVSSALGGQPAARQRYLPHPDHDALKAIFRPVLERIIVLDYTLQAGDAVSI
ncbi:Dabb family protein [Aeromonas sp. ASNIH6]|uniref:Dabb family protein n=1 Tax=Aeromonas sp. ASNIH6 TaxID=1758188 RepID=UPI0035BBE912